MKGQKVMIFKRGQIWWCAFRNGARLVRKSLGTKDIQMAKSLSSILELTLKKTIKREQAHAFIDSLFADDVAYGLPLESTWTEYERLTSASGKRVSKDAEKRRRIYWKSFVDFCQKETNAKTLNAITRDIAVSFVSKLNQTSKKGKTRKNIIATIASVWNMLAISINAPKIFDGLMPDCSDSEHREAFTKEEEAQLLFRARGAFSGKWYLPSLISRYTGLRYSDVKGLQWRDIDGDWVLRLAPNKTKAHGIRVVLPIVEPLLSELKKAKEKSSSPYILPSHALLGERARKNETFSDLLVLCGISTSNHTFHSWRHTFRTRLSEAGVSDDIVKRLGGWTQDATAMKYDHAERIEELRRVIC